MGGRSGQGSNRTNRSQGKSRRGFAAMSSDLQRQIARKGGQASARVQRRDEYGQFSGGKGRSSGRLQARRTRSGSGRSLASRRGSR
jgi:Stress-induced bacterial acidophilic repeat motif